MLTVSTSLIGLSLALAAFAQSSASLPACPTTRNAAFDYIVVGSGAGGGTTAARLARNGFKVLLMDAGIDYVARNTTIPLYLARATEDPEIELTYYVDLYPPGDKLGRNVTNWYPRAQALGGCTVHNALITQIPHAWDYNTIESLFGDSSWSPTAMQKYFTMIENNTYIPESQGVALGHGYSGWLTTQGPAMNLVTDPKYYDPMLIDLLTSWEDAFTPIPGSDWSTPGNDLANGGGIVPLTKNQTNNRRSVRDHIVEVHTANPNALVLQLQTLATKVLTCRETTGKIRAYGVQGAINQYLPGSPKFTTKYGASQTFTNFYANNEIIVAGGAYETPHLLMLSGIGDPVQLKANNISTVVDLPGVGQNFQDRIEMSVVWNLNKTYVLEDGCVFGYTDATDPCLEAWDTDGHTNLYTSGPSIYAHSYQSNTSLPYRDMWSMSGPGSFKGYRPGWGAELADVHNAWVDTILKAHTASRGWVKLNGPHPQDTLNINKNLGQTTGFDNDVEVVLNEIKRSRAIMASNHTMNRWVVEEYWPGSAVATDAEITQFIYENSWGHHACCTSKMGVSTDPEAVVNNNFQVYGIDNLRVVDNSVWANIPGTFVTTPIYIISEKAAATIMAYAATQSWKPTYSPTSGP